MLIPLIHAGALSADLGCNAGNAHLIGILILNSAVLRVAGVLPQDLKAKALGHFTGLIRHRRLLSAVQHNRLQILAVAAAVDADHRVSLLDDVLTVPAAHISRHGAGSARIDAIQILGHKVQGIIALHFGKGLCIQGRDSNEASLHLGYIQPLKGLDNSLSTLILVAVVAGIHHQRGTVLGAHHQHNGNIHP